MRYASLEHGGQHLEGYEEALQGPVMQKKKADMSCYELPSYFVEQRRHKVKNLSESHTIVFRFCFFPTVKSDSNTVEETVGCKCRI